MVSEECIDSERIKEVSRCLKNIKIMSFCEKRILFFLLMWKACKAANTQQMFLCHQCLMCLIDVWAIIGKNSNACSKIITLRAGLIRPNEFQSSLSGNCWGRHDGHIWWIQVWARSWHARSRENHEYIWGFLCQWNTKHCQKQSKHTSPFCIIRQRTITLEFLRTEWYEIKWWWQSRKMQFKKSCWRIKKTQLSLELSRAYKTSRQ